MSLLSDGSSWLSGVFHTDEAVNVEYTLAENGLSFSMTATITAQTMELEAGVFATQRTQSRDFIIRRVDLYFFDEFRNPSPGDRISYVMNSITYTYEVMEIPGEGAWRWHDNYQQDYRIHGTLVESE